MPLTTEYLERVRGRYVSIRYGSQKGSLFTGYLTDVERAYTLWFVPHGWWLTFANGFRARVHTGDTVAQVSDTTMSVAARRGWRLAHRTHQT